MLHRLVRWVLTAMLGTGGMLALAPAQSVSADSVPTVNGLFYGDGDHALYTYIDTSYYGSKLYTYYHAPTTTVYVALVADRSVNDNVFGASDPSYSGNYMGTAGWGAGGGQQRSAAALTNSEYAEFTFACDVNSPRTWTWQQGYACESGGLWMSDATCATSSGMTSGFPPSWQSASSFAWNINAYDSATSPWDMFVFGTDIGSWKSPFSYSDPNTDPPSNPNTVIGLEGYPAPTSADDLSLGPPITFSSSHQWEWPIVYEWSLDVGPSGADCGGNALYLITGVSHHSPMKELPGGEDPYGCGEGNDCFPDDGGDPDPFADWGDLPDSYGTTAAAGGASHELTASGPYLGQNVEFETDGSPTTDATGDGPEEDGVVRDANDTWQPDATVGLTVTVTGDNGYLVGWFDWNGDGDFDETNEQVVFGAVVSGTHSYSLTIPSTADASMSTINMRYRLYENDPASYSPTGTVTGGEIEDHQWPFNDYGTTAVTVKTFVAKAAQRPAQHPGAALALLISAAGILAWMTRRTTCFPGTHHSRDSGHADP